MHNTKLWRAFSSLTTTELKQFGWFLDSPYHNRRAELCLLLTLLKEYRRTQKIPDSVAIWEQVFPEKEYEEATFSHLKRYFLEKLEAFFVINDLRNQDSYTVHIARAYERRGLSEMANSVRNRALKSYRKSENIRSEQLYDVFMLEQMQFTAHEKDRRAFKPGLQNLSDSIDHWFLVQKLKIACTMGSQQKVFRAEYDIAFLESVLETAGQSPWKEMPLIALYLHTFRMLGTNESEIAYHQQSKLLQSHGQLLSQVERRTLFLMAVNFCIRQLNQGINGYLQEVYRLYKNGLEDGWLFERNGLSPWTYKNIVSAGLKLQDFNWVLSFIEGYRSYLPEEFRETFYRYNLAELQLAKGAFREVLRILRFLQVRDPLTHLRARIAQIKAGFELQEFRFVESQLDNLRQILRRKKELAYHKEAYLNFEKLLRRFITLHPDDGVGKTQLHYDLDHTEILAEREWLETKMN